MRGIGAGSRIFEILERNPLIVPDKGVALSPTRRGALAFEDIAFRYPSRPSVEVLKGYNMKLEVGESVAIV